MAEIQINVNRKKGNADGPGFRALREDHFVSRVPQVGELIALDTDGHSAWYRVVLVIHEAAKPGKLDAAIYAERVALTDYLKSAAEASVPADDADVVPRGTD